MFSTVGKVRSLSRRLVSGAEGISERLERACACEAKCQIFGGLKRFVR
jgi:hypothetical protein